MPSFSQLIKDYAKELGFTTAGIVPATPSPQLDAYLRWLDRGMHGSMEYMSRSDRVARRRDLTAVLPRAKSLIVAVMDYYTGPPPPQAFNPAHGRISGYAWGLDYHTEVKKRLQILALLFRNPETQTKAHAFVDTGAFLERSHAEQAGLGFVGKNTMLIHPRRGSTFFLGEVITTAELEYDEPIRDRMPGCGTCTHCLTACPTAAFPEPYVLDARRCISYLTIEHMDVIPIELRSLMGNWVYGCDICQEVCPWQRFAKPANRPLFAPVDADRAAPPLEVLLRLTDATFASRFAGTTIFRIGRKKMLANASIAAGNSGEQGFASDLSALLRDPDRVIRSHAAWALGRLHAGQDALYRARSRERNGDVRLEIDSALAAV
jgi:epoxyqueuosine reductase